MTHLTVQVVRRLGRTLLKNSREADELLAFCLNIPFSAIHFSDQTMPQQAWEIYRALIQRRIEGEPVQQILGYVDFLGCRITLTQDVLIPRQETELLADDVVQFLKKKSDSQKILVDVCTGSGCLAIALKKAVPSLHVIGIDISSKALALAQKNALDNQVDIEFLQGDFLNPLKGRSVDFLISNPPYVSEKEYDDLDLSVRCYEPKIALVSGPTGLEFYQRLKKECSAILNRPGYIFLEIGYAQGKAVQSIFSSWGGVLHQDLAGHDRYFSLEIQ